MSSISDFSYAIGASPKSVRHWVERGQAFPHARAEAGDWASFDEADVIHGSLLVALMNTLNLPVREADEIVSRMIRPPGHHAVLPSPGGGPLVRTELEPIQLPSAHDPEFKFKGKIVVLLRVPGIWKIGIFPAGHRFKTPLEKSSVRVLLDAHSVISEALSRFRARVSARAFLSETTRREIA